MRIQIAVLSQLLIVAATHATCPDSFIDESRWSTSSPVWSADIEYVIANFSLSNDAGGDVDFSSLSMAETIQAWVPTPDGANPYEEASYGFDSSTLTFKTAPAGETYSNGATITWDVAFDVSGAPATYPKEISLRPEEGSAYGQFSYTMLSSEFSCSEGEPFYAEITEAEVGLGEILLTVAAAAGASAITSFEATCEDSDGNMTNASSTGTSITINDLEGGEDYTCTVTATNSVGTSAESDPTGTLTPTTQSLPIWLLYEASTP